MLQRCDRVEPEPQQRLHRVEPTENGDTRSKNEHALIKASPGFRMNLNDAIENCQIAACIIAAMFHIAVGLSMAYSAVLVPSLEAQDSDIPASREETSWMGKCRHTLAFEEVKVTLIAGTRQRASWW